MINERINGTKGGKKRKQKCSCYTLGVAGVPLHPRSTGDAVPLDNVDGDCLVLAAGRAGRAVAEEGRVGEGVANLKERNSLMLLL